MEAPPLGRMAILILMEQKVLGLLGSKEYQTSQVQAPVGMASNPRLALRPGD